MDRPIALKGLSAPIRPYVYVSLEDPVFTTGAHSIYIKINMYRWTFHQCREIVIVIVVAVVVVIVPVTLSFLSPHHPPFPASLHLSP